MLMEEQLQRGMATFEEDAEFEEDEEMGLDIRAQNAHSYAANSQLRNGLPADPDSDEEEDLQGEDDEEDEEAISDGDEEGDDDDIRDPADDMGEEDEEMEENEEDMYAEEEDDDAEGVGAVKIKPRRHDGDATSGSEVDDDDDSSAVIEEDEDASDAEVEVGWVPAAEEDEEPANPNRCMFVSPRNLANLYTNNFRFCQLDEENDPSEEFELYLACAVCGDNGISPFRLIIL